MLMLTITEREIKVNFGKLYILKSVVIESDFSDPLKIVELPSLRPVYKKRP